MTDRRRRAPLSVETDLDLTVDGVPVDIASTGDRLLVDIPALGTALAVLDDVPIHSADRAAAFLRVADLTVEVRVRGTPVALLGAGARPGSLSRGLGAAPLELRAGGAAVAAGRGLLAGLRALGRLLD